MSSRLRPSLVIRSRHSRTCGSPTSHRFYPEAKSKGAQFLTGPLDRKAEIRCYLRDPDGYLIEIGQATGMLHGVYADRTAKDD